MKAPRILFVDDDETLRRVLTRELAELGFEVSALPSAQGVVEFVRQDCPDAVLLDMRLPGASGLDVLKQIRAADESCQVVVFTGHGAVPEAVEAMRAGAHDFLTKPARLDVLDQALRRAAEKHALIRDVARLKRALEPRAGTTGLLGEGAVIQRLRREIERVAASASSVLIQGENGTGKELVARNLHALSPRREAPFVVVNCGAIPASLFESELFGHEKGAFTGADKKRIGLFEAAHGGTLFLDEIGELPKAFQASLLRATQFGEVRPVGSERTRSVDVRVVAATNRRIVDMIARGEFREDLYYRVATLVLEVPALRERREDVPSLARAFLERCALRSGRHLTLAEEALERLVRYDWPGNVRELENAIERLTVMCDGGEVSGELVSRYVVPRDAPSSELPTLEIEELERRAVVAALERHAGDKKAAARTLGIALKTLYNKMDRFGLRPAPSSGSETEP